MNGRYQESEALLERALKSIPLGAQTFSKSTTQYPHGVSPFFAEHGSGCYLWDADGNRYLDYVNSLGAIILGYHYPAINEAVKQQLDKGSIFSLSNKLEIEVAERLKALIPCAELVRFGKNGSDVTSAAIRLARAYTQKKHIAVCGYHGWHDWYIGSTSMHLGVPEEISQFTHLFEFNNVASLQKIFDQYSGQVAAVIMEPMHREQPNQGFLQQIKHLTEKNAALLIFDEMITGFRIALGGGQEYFNVTPDLATFGKGLANGFPLSAIVGHKDIMQLFNKVFFSFTFGGETLSLAACLACLTTFEKEPVIKHLTTIGEKLCLGIKEILKDPAINDFLSISGHPAWTFLNFKDHAHYSQWEIKTLFMQELFSRNILSLGSHNLSYSHQAEDIEITVLAYKEIFNIIKDAINTQTLIQKLHCKPIKPLFTLR